LRVKHGSKFGEVVLLGKKAFIIHDIDDENKTFVRADLHSEGHLINIQESSIEEYEREITGVDIPEKVFIKEKLFENLKSIFGKDVEILINY
jgi:hypothetical protein